MGKCRKQWPGNVRTLCPHELQSALNQAVLRLTLRQLLNDVASTQIVLIKRVFGMTLWPVLQVIFWQ